MVQRSEGKRMLLFSDESGFCLHPRLGRLWAKKGTQPVVLTRSQHQKRLNIFGWVDPVKGCHGMLKQPKGNTDGFLAMLRAILRRYRKVTLDIWVDHARWHKGSRVIDFLSEHRRLRISYIPKYHPELNPQEVLWRTMRYEETTNTYYEVFEQMVAAIFKRSQRWKPNKILSLCQLI
jgi:transposase